MLRSEVVLYELTLNKVIQSSLTGATYEELSIFLERNTFNLGHFIWTGCFDSGLLVV